ncbi:TetR/AcrR family transcriptional regulator [Cellulophaga sp. F20128]|uniref:TetR/AcrR family transcriptional regulator n=1 Tax=Cellulophaga sp. F20128 TaxID=2926413 RepID=UPI001FF1B395|nr:TetR/AcrR family transcriptional regulator [Cellulophaga sp. F20128]MCK0158745.1 TetR/AcrR family transcriptional regulator [Cellulophaga sp. F20128]
MKLITKKEKFHADVLKLIYEKGFKATTIRDIAKNGNFEVANVYNYIDSKEAFLEGCIFNIFNEFNGYIDDILESSFSPKEKLKYVVSKHVQFTMKEPYQVALFVYDWRNLNEPKLSEFKQLRKAYILKVETIISQGMKEGQFRTMDSEIATFLVFSSLRWIFNIIIHKKGEKKINVIELEKQINDFIFGGIESKGINNGIEL